ncbi:hypothetical protein ACTXT7_011505 [Hymenolepis weldensis]
MVLHESAILLTTRRVVVDIERMTSDIADERFNYCSTSAQSSIPDWELNPDRMGEPQESKPLIHRGGKVQEFADLSRVFWHLSEADRRRLQKIRINECCSIN